MDKTKTGYQIYGGTKRLALTYRGTGANYIETKTDLIEKLPHARSRSQQTIALSSAEAELYALGKGAQE